MRHALVLTKRRRVFLPHFVTTPTSYYARLTGTEVWPDPVVFAGGFTLGAAAPTNPQAYFPILPAANASGVTADQSYYLFEVAPAGAVTIPTGTAPLVATAFFAEPNITATGTVTVGATVYIKDAPTEGGTNHALFVDSGTCRFDGNFTFSAAAHTDTIIANTAAAYVFSDGTVNVLALDTRNTVTGVVTVLVTSPAVTIAGASGSTYSQVGTAAKTITTSTQTGITALDGLALTIGAMTIAQSGGAVTVTTASALYISKVVAGSSVTITNNYIVNTNQSGCFCTAGGVWTDTASTARVKRGIADAGPEDVLGILGKLRPRTWQYDPEKVGDDKNRQRFGIVSEELPDCFRIPGVDDDQGGLNGSILGSFGLAALKCLLDENRTLKARLETLEAKVG